MTNPQYDPNQPYQGGYPQAQQMQPGGYPQYDQNAQQPYQGQPQGQPYQGQPYQGQPYQGQPQGQPQGMVPGGTDPAAIAPGGIGGGAAAGAANLGPAVSFESIPDTVDVFAVTSMSDTPSFKDVAMDADVVLRAASIDHYTTKGNNPKTLERLNCDFAVLTGPNAGTVVRNAVIFGKVIVARARDAFARDQRLIMGYVTMGEARNGNNAPTILESLGNKGSTEETRRQLMDLGRAFAINENWLSLEAANKPADWPVLAQAKQMVAAANQASAAAAGAASGVVAPNQGQPVAQQQPAQQGYPQGQPQYDPNAQQGYPQGQPQYDQNGQPQGYPQGQPYQG